MVAQAKKDEMVAQAKKKIAELHQQLAQAIKSTKYDVAHKIQKEIEALA